MYNEHFGFNESPFNVTSDPRFFYSNRLYQEAFTGLRWGIKLRQGLNRSVLEEIGDALRVKGYTIPETRLSSSRTQGDIRFFFLRTGATRRA